MFSFSQSAQLAVQTEFFFFLARTDRSRTCADEGGRSAGLAVCSRVKGMCHLAVDALDVHEKGGSHTTGNKQHMVEMAAIQVPH
jgi:hypothetical protein